MIWRRWRVLLLLAIVPSMVGCAPINIIDYRRGEVPQVSTAPIAETYTLMDDNANQRIESTTFNRADDIGFIRQEGQLKAVAGDDRIPLSEGNYSWVIERSRFRFPSGPLSHRSSDTYTSARGALVGLGAAAVAAVVMSAVNAAP